MTAGGMVMVKLKEMADALSEKPVLLACKKKNRITSKRGIPWKPGSRIFLLFLTRNLTGVDTRNLLFKRVSQCMQII
jgi:hypothetical protein